MTESHGGPYQYLQAKHQENSSWTALSEKILQLAPKKTTVKYQCATDPYPTGNVLLHLTDFGVNLRASSKGIPPYAHTAQKLADEMITHGFSSDHDHMIIATIGVGKEAAAPFWTTWVKGMARACTALTIWSMLIDLRCNPMDDFGAPWVDCFAKVHAEVTAVSSRSAIALENNKISTMGAIRKQWDALTWCSCLQQLKEDGHDPDSILQQQDKIASKAAKLTGGKRVPVKT